MTVLTQAIAIGDNEIHIDSALAAGQVPGYIQIDDELLNVGGQDNLAGKVLTLSSPAREEHDNGATVTYAGRPFDPTFKTALAGDGDAEQVTYSRTTTLTDAQVKALPTTGIEILPAPDAGTIRDWTRIIVSSNLTAAYTNVDAGCVIQVRYGAAGFLQEYYNSGTYFDASFVSSLLNSTTDTVLTILPVLDAGEPTLGSQPLASYPYADLQDSLLFKITNNAAGNFTGGNSANVVKVTVIYSIVELA